MMIIIVPFQSSDLGCVDVCHRCGQDCCDLVDVRDPAFEQLRECHHFGDHLRLATETKSAEALRK